MKIKLVLLLFIFSSVLIAQENRTVEKIVRNYADNILAKSTWRFIDHKTKRIYSDTSDIPEGIDIRIERQENTWLYSIGILNIAMLELGEYLEEEKYKEFTFKNIEFAFNNYKWFERHQTDMTYWVFPFGMLYTMDALDCCGSMGSSLIEVCETKSKKEYEDYIEKAADFIIHREHRLEDGTFARLNPSKMTVWADDLYMALSFLSRYAKLKNDNKIFNLAVDQVINFRKYLYNPHTELYHHGWYSDIQENVAAHWGRANGWVIMAQINLLDQLPENHPRRNELLDILQEQVIGLSKYQSESGLWRQLLDKPDSYLETTSTAMIIFSIARAIRKGYLDKRYSSIADRGWEGLLSKLNTNYEIESACKGTSMRNDLVFYYQRPQITNDKHVLGSFILAGIEMMRREREDN